MKSIALFYKDGGSDKVYNVQIVDKENNLYSVDFQYGRRGNSLTTGTKTNNPVDFATAEKVFDKLVKEKQAKGYTQDKEGTLYKGSELDGQQVGIIPWLPNPIILEKAQELLEDDDWFMQEKMDGRHMMATVGKDNYIICTNRKGIAIATSDKITEGLLELKGKTFQVDGESMGDFYCLFDLLVLEGIDYMNINSLDRYSYLFDLVTNSDNYNITLVETAVTTSQKKELFNKIKVARGEGVVFKKKDAAYISGRPASSGNILKYKFVESATCKVLKQNGDKRSVAIAILSNLYMSDPPLIEIGNVTIPINYDIPLPEELIEVSYLYAYPKGSLYQPVYKGPRLDKDIPDTYSSLKFKQGSLEEDN